MASHTTEVLTGAAVIAAAAGFFFYASSGDRLGARAGAYDLTARFRSVEGITVGTDVRLAGVKVGTVTSLALDPTTFYAQATLSVRDDVLLPDDSSALISSEGLLGGAFVELQPGGSLENLAPGEEIEDTQGAVSVISLLMKFAGGSEESAAPDDAALE
jgi:phospholipid/cholesterol/gamma-HCH transport system substrate-binding protein